MAGARLLEIIALALFFGASCTVLPGIVLKLIANYRRLRGRPSESPPIVGPLFAIEMLRLARGGVHLRLRVLYAVVLMIGLLATYVREFKELSPIDLIVGHDVVFPLDRMASFAASFAQMFFICQLIALSLITPVLAGGAIIEEKDRLTIDFLRSSLLSNREIIVGKLLARLVYIFGFAMTGLPILTLTMLFGGIDGTVLVVCFVAAFISTLSLATFSIWMATRAETLRPVLINAYVVVFFLLVVSGCCITFAGPYYIASPFVFTIATLNEAPLRTWVGFNLDSATAIFVLLHGSASVVCTLLALGGIRTYLLSAPQQVSRAALPIYEDDALKPRWELQPEVENDTSKPRRVHHPEFELPRRERAPLRLKPVPPMRKDDDPLLWKERHFADRVANLDRSLQKGCMFGLLIAVVVPVGLGIFTAVIILIVDGRSPSRFVNPLLFAAALAAIVAFAPFAGMMATSTVVRERKRQTLDSLLILPIERVDILWAKVLASALWLKPWLIGLAIFAAFAVVTRSVHPVCCIVVGILIAAMIAFSLSLGIWLSVRCLTVARAATWYLVILATIFALPPMLAVFFRFDAWEWFGIEEVDHYIEALSPPLAAYGLIYEWRYSRRLTLNEHMPAICGSLMATILLSLSAIALWRSAKSHFENEGR